MAEAILEYQSYYTDTGCAEAESCLQCPFPQCIEDTGGAQRLIKESRNKEINLLYIAGKTLKELAAIFHVSRRTIDRAVRLA